MSCSARKFLAAGHIGSFQIHPRTPGISKGRCPLFHARQRSKKQVLLGGSTPLFFAQLRRIPIAVGGFAALRIWDAELGSRKGQSGRFLPEKPWCLSPQKAVRSSLPSPRRRRHNHPSRRRGQTTGRSRRNTRPSNPNRRRCSPYIHRSRCQYSRPSRRR